MNPLSPEVGSPGYTDSIDARLDRVAHLLAVQQTKARSKRMLLSLFQNFAKVTKERRNYVEHLSGIARTQTVSWADGYLQGTVHAINYYLEKRWSMTGLTFEECELIIERPTLTQLLEHGSTGTDSDQTGETDAAGSADLPDREAGRSFATDTDA